MILRTLSTAAFNATQVGTTITFTDGPSVGTMKSFVTKDTSFEMENLKINITHPKTVIEEHAARRGTMCGSKFALAREI